MRIAVRVFVMTFAFTAIVSSLLTYLRTGVKNPEFGGLLFRPEDRFRDLTNTLEGIRLGNPYSSFTTTSGSVFPFGNVYPPTHVALLKPLTFVPDDVAATIVTLALGVGIGLALTITQVVRSEPWRAKPITLWRRGGCEAVVCAAAVPAIVVLSHALDYYAVILAITSVIALLFAFAPTQRKVVWLYIPLLIIFVTCYPTTFALDRLNIDILVFAALSAAIVLADRRMTLIPAVLFGSVFALKLYPLAFVGNSLARGGQRIRFAIATIVSAAAFTTLGIGLINTAPVDILTGYAHGLTWFKDTYALGPAGMNYTVSLFNGILAIVFINDGTYPEAFANDLYAIWTPLQIVVIVAAIAIAVFARYAPWARWLVTTSAVITFIPATSEYRMVILLIPIALWVRQITHPTRADHQFVVLHALTAGLLGLALAPKTFFTPFLGFITTDTVVTPWIMLALLITAGALGWITREPHQRVRSPTQSFCA